MARADLILGLVKARRTGDDAQVRRAVEALATDERTKNHTILADRLLAIFQMSSGRSRPPAPVPDNACRGGSARIERVVRGHGMLGRRPPIHAQRMTDRRRARTSAIRLLACDEIGYVRPVGQCTVSGFEPIARAHARQTR